MPKPLRYQMSDQRRDTTAQGTPIATYNYTQEDGVVVFQVVRFQPKGFRTRQPDGQGGWRWSFDGLCPTLYRLPEVLDAHTVVIVEGEKDVETLFNLSLPSGWAATTNPFGACQWWDLYSSYLYGKRVFICPDTDAPGQEHLMQVGLSLVKFATEIRVVRLPSSVKDVTEWVTAGGQLEEFMHLVEKADLFDYPRPDSDLMQNIQSLTESMDQLLSLEGVAYEWKAPERQGNLTGTQHGLIAQAVEQVFPEWVGVDNEGFKTLCIRGFEPLAIEALKTLNVESEGLKQSLGDLEERLAALMARLEERSPSTVLSEPGIQTPNSESA